jgi:parvulin-like peptidyl-prolyl isomerase
MSEIDAMVAPVYNEYKSAYQGEELERRMADVRRKMIEQLVEQKLLLSAARKENVEVTDKEVDPRIDEIRKKFASHREFEQALSAERTSLKDLRTRYRNQLIIRKFIDKKVVSKINISPVDIKSYYDAHLAEFAEPEAVKVHNILIRVKPEEADSAAKALDLANTILARLKDGQDFEALAKVYSEGPGAGEGGLMERVKKGDLKKEIDDAIFNLSAGQTSEVIKTDMGYHIFRVEEKFPPQTKDLSDVRGEIEDRIFRDRINQGVRGLVTKLRKDAYIVLK